jgi:integrase
MASLVARHSRKCALGGKELAAPETGPIPGCTCKPSFAARFRDPSDNRNRIERFGNNRKAAIAKLNKLGVQIEEGEVVAENIRFAEWGDQWLASLERKDNTVNSYRPTIAYAKEAFGSKIVRKLQPGDITAVNRLMRDRGITDSTRAKHLRVLGGCFNSAISHGYATNNPVKRLPASEKPAAQKKEAAYFTHDELPRLFAEIPEGLYRTVCLVALKTGMRQGELIALTWNDVDLQGGMIRVARNYTAGYLTTPKNKEVRQVNLPPEVVDLLGAWWGGSGKPEQSALVFPREAGGGYMPSWSLIKQALYPAMQRAGIAREGEKGTKRTFHSFRHTYAKVALENGRRLTWLQRQLGHKSLAITTDTYGHWGDVESKDEAEKMEGAFSV